MALGEKLFEEKGKVMVTGIQNVHPVEGVTIGVTFSSEIKGVGKFPSARNMGGGTSTQYPHGIVDAQFQGVVTMAEGDQYFWWGHEKSKLVEGGKIKGLLIVTGFTNSQKLSWMNNLIIAIDSEFNPETQEFHGTAYEWK